MFRVEWPQAYNGASDGSDLLFVIVFLSDFFLKWSNGIWNYIGIKIHALLFIKLS